MTTTELMIGNWVLDTRTNRPLQVNPFMAELETPEWVPIPLSQKILEKNDFRKAHRTQRYKWQDMYGYSIIIDLDDNSLVIKFDNQTIINVIFRKFVPVHFLQNALIFTNIKLKITI